MADNKEEILLRLKIESDKANAALRKTDVAIKKTVQSFKNLKKGSIEYQEAQAKLASLQANYAQQSSRYNKALESYIGAKNKGLTGVSNATGAATSATLELGRAISDAPYGIRGVANNLSQFASQFSFMANKVDETTGKVAGFTGAMKNLGKAIKANAILLIIQAVISAFDYFSTSVSKADKEIKVFSDSVSKGFVNIAKLESLNSILQDSNSTISQQKEALEDLKKLGFDPANEGIVEFIENQKKLVVVNAAMKAIEGELEDVYKKRLDLQQRFKEEFKTLLTLQQENGFGQDISKAILEEIKVDSAELDKKEEELKKELKKLIKRSLDLDIDDDDSKLPKVKLESLIDTKIDPKSKFKAFADAFGFNLKKQLEKNRISAGDGIDLTISPEQQEQIDKYNKELSEKLVKEYKAEALDERLGEIKKGMSVISDFIASEYERELTIERNKTNVLNGELNQRLLNEKLSAEERKNIQLKIAQNDEALRKKENKIKKEQFNTQKAFNISNALIDTGRAAAGVMAEAKGGFFTRLSQAIPTIAFGLAQVAMIARQKFQPSAPSTPSRTSTIGGSGSTQSRQPVFNIVGRSSESQLAEVIQGQFNKPVKAYVVSKEVTTQQQLDLNIQSSASI